MSEDSIPQPPNDDELHHDSVEAARRIFPDFRDEMLVRANPREGQNEGLHGAHNEILLDTSRHKDPEVEGRLKEVSPSTYQRVKDEARGKRRALAAAAHEMYKEGRIDELTGLGSRAKLDQDLSQAYRNFEETGVPFGLAMFDIDHFKAINDTYGHLAGDKFIKGFGRGLLRRSRKGDDFYRPSGDEFVAITHYSSEENNRRHTLDNVSEAETRASERYEKIASEIVQELIAEYHIDLQTYIGASIGFAVIRPDESLEAFRMRVDDLLHESKVNRSKSRQEKYGDKHKIDKDPRNTRELRQKITGWQPDD